VAVTLQLLGEYAKAENHFDAGACIDEYDYLIIIT